MFMSAMVFSRGERWNVPLFYITPKYAADTKLVKHFTQKFKFRDVQHVNSYISCSKLVYTPKNPKGLIKVGSSSTLDQH